MTSTEVALSNLILENYSSEVTLWEFQHLLFNLYSTCIM